MPHDLCAVFAFVFHGRGSTILAAHAVRLSGGQRPLCCCGGCRTCAPKIPTIREHRAICVYSSHLAKYRLDRLGLSECLGGLSEAFVMPVNGRSDRTAVEDHLVLVPPAPCDLLFRKLPLENSVDRAFP